MLNMKVIFTLGLPHSLFIFSSMFFGVNLYNRLYLVSYRFLSYPRHTHTYTHKQINKQTNTHTHTHTHIYIYIYAWMAVKMTVCML